MSILDDETPQGIRLNYEKSFLDLPEKITIHNLTLLWELPGSVVEKMEELKELDLRNNMLRHMRANLLRGPPQLEQVYLGGNNWDCSDGGLDWLAMENENGTIRKKVVDYYKLICHQQLHRGKPLHKVMDIIRKFATFLKSSIEYIFEAITTDR